MKQWLQDLVDSDVSGVPKCVLTHFYQANYYKKFERNLEFIFAGYVGKEFGDSTNSEIRERIRILWSDMYLKGMVDCRVDEMPTYELEFDHNRNLIFGWNDERGSDENNRRQTRSE